MGNIPDDTMKTFCFTVDDNIRFLKEIAQDRPESIFDHPYLAMYRRLHREYGVKVQLNLFYRLGDFELSQMPDAYRGEWAENADWLKLSFHADYEKEDPYILSGYEEVYEDCRKVHENIIRFAAPAALAKTTTIHWCQTTEDGVRALADLGIKGLLGLFGSSQNPKTSYSIREEQAKELRRGKTLKIGEVYFAAIALVLNNYSKEEILEKLGTILERDAIKVMIHEQYFYSDYPAYQRDFEEKLGACFAFLNHKGYVSCLFEDVIGECH